MNPNALLDKATIPALDCLPLDFFFYEREVNLHLVKAVLFCALSLFLSLALSLPLFGYL